MHPQFDKHIRIFPLLQLVDDYTAEHFVNGKLHGGAFILKGSGQVADTQFCADRRSPMDGNPGATGGKRRLIS
jgi:hypothetical protein